MRFIQVSVPAGKLDAVRGVLDGEGVSYTVTEETSGEDTEAVVGFPLPTNAVEAVLDALREVGIDDRTEAVVFDTETVISKEFEALEERYEDDAENGERISREELSAKVRELAPTRTTYATLTVVSAVIAAAGLLLDSPAVVVGSMVIAPLIGPAMAASVGTVLDDDELVSRGVRLQVLGFALAVGSAAVFAFVVKTAHLVPPGLDVVAIPEIRERLSPDFLSLAVALGAGVAGVLSLSTGVSSALVGVMIAVALVPPAATVGIGIAWGLPLVSVGAGILALVNWASINFAALVVLWYMGYRPERWFRLSDVRSTTIKRIALLAAAIAVLSLFLGGVTLASFQSATFEQDAQDVAEGVLAEEGASRLVEFDVEYDGQLLVRQPSRVFVTVGQPPGAETPALAGPIADRIAAETGRRVTVEVRFVEVEVARA